LKHYKGI